MKGRILYQNSNYAKYLLFFTFCHIYVLNVDISIVPVLISMKCLPVINNINMKGTVSQILFICSRFDFITKNGKHLIVICLTFILHFMKLELQPILNSETPFTCKYILYE